MQLTRTIIIFLLACTTATAVPPGNRTFSGEIPITGNRSSFEVDLKGNSSSVISLSIMGPKVAQVTARAIKIVPKKQRRTVKPWTFSFIEADKQRANVQARGCIPAAVELPEEGPLPSFEDLGLSADLYQRLFLLLLQVKTELDATPTIPTTERCTVVSLETKALIESTLIEAIADSGIPNATWTPEDTCILLNTHALGDAYRYFGITPDMTLATFQAGSVTTRSATRLELSEYSAIMRKDSCDPAQKKLRYKVLITILFNKNVEDGLARVSFTEKSYSGYRGTSIKPVSDGRFAPQPILLMSSLTSCFQELSFVSWSKGRPSVSSLQLEDTISYRGASYNRVPIGVILRGGKGVFELGNGQSSYGVCLALSATRQVVNGYPLSRGEY